VGVCREITNAVIRINRIFICGKIDLATDKKRLAPIPCG